MYVLANLGEHLYSHGLFRLQSLQSAETAKIDKVGQTISELARTLLFLQLLRSAQSNIYNTQMHEKNIN